MVFKLFAQSHLVSEHSLICLRKIHAGCSFIVLMDGSKICICPVQKRREKRRHEWRGGKRRGVERQKTQVLISLPELRDPWLHRDTFTGPLAHNNSLYIALKMC